MNIDHRGLLEYVANVVDEELHDLDPLRRRGRVRLRAMLKRCAQTKRHDFAYVPLGYLRPAAP